MVYVTLQLIYVIVTTSIEHFAVFVYNENIFLECFLELIYYVYMSSDGPPKQDSPF